MIRISFSFSDKYFPRLARLAGGHPFPSSSSNGGRQFQHLYKDNLEKLRDRVEQLKESGAKEAISQVRAAAKRVKDEGLLADDVGAGKFFTYTTKTRSNLTIYSRITMAPSFLRLIS